MDDHTKLRVEVAAAKIAVEWKHLFATELKAAARQLAQGADVLTVDHYTRALPLAALKILQAANTQSALPSDVQRQVA